MTLMSCYCVAIIEMVDRVVAREERAIVLEHDQVERFDLRVGRVDVREVDRAGAERLPRELVLDAPDARQVEPVAAREARIAVGPAEELVGQAESQVAVRRGSTTTTRSCGLRPFACVRR